jgi:hypothetical protein
MAPELAASTQISLVLRRVGAGRMAGLNPKQLIVKAIKGCGGSAFATESRLR